MCGIRIAPRNRSRVRVSAFCGKDAFRRFATWRSRTQTRRRTVSIPTGSVTQRNLGRKDNKFSSLDFRLTKAFPYGKCKVEPATTSSICSTQ
jgi:hypothetical protein